MKHIFNQSLLSLIVLILISGCATMNSRWRDTSSVNSIAAYQDFLRRYPKGALADEARSRIEKLYFEQARAKDNISGYEDFLRRYPKGPLSDEARSRRALLWLQRAKDTNTIEAYENFLSHYPEGPLSDEARLSLKSLKNQIKHLRDAAKKVLPKEANVQVTSISRFPNRPEFLISAHLLKGHSADETNPYVRGNYGTHEKLTRLIKYRCAKVLKSIAKNVNLHNASKIVIQGRHGVRQTPLYNPFGGKDVAMTIYQISISTDEIKKHNWMSIKEKEVVKLWSVDKNIIPRLHFQTIPIFN